MILFLGGRSEKLKEKGINVWYDDFAITVGDSLLNKINEGLRESRYGIVIFSKAFFNKRWTQKELAGLFALENDREKKILPVWLNIDIEEIKNSYPILADIYAADASKGIKKVVSELTEVIAPKRNQKQGSFSNSIDCINALDNNDEIKHDKPTIFFSDRIADAFPGIRNIQEITNSKEIIKRLSIVLKKPLQFKGYYPSLILYTDIGCIDIYCFDVINKDKILINTREIIPKKLIVYRPSSYWQCFLYIESIVDKATGLYSGRSKVEEYAINCDGNIVTREEYDDGSIYRNGKISKLVNPKPRIRYLTPNNFIIASRESPMNINEFDKNRKIYMDDILAGTKTINDFINLFNKLSRHPNDSK